MVSVRLAEERDGEKWDAYVNRSTTGTFYHLFGWKQVLEKTYKLKPYYLVALGQGDEIVGTLPLFLMRNILFKKFLISNPFSNYCGVCADSEAIADQLIESAKSIGIDRNTQYLELRCLGESSGRPDQIRGEFVNMMLDLSQGADNVWNNQASGTVRNRVRKAMKNGLEFDAGKNYLNEFYNIFSQNMRDLGTPIHSNDFFRNILETFPDSTEILVVKHEAQVIGSMFCFSFGSTISEPWVSTLRSHSCYCPADFLYWEAVKHACEKGLQEFDFGRSTVNAGTFKFKKKWGAVPVPMHYHYYLNRADHVPEVNAVDNKYQLAVDIWKKSPLVFTNAIGPALVKYLPEL